MAWFVACQTDYKFVIMLQTNDGVKAFFSTFSLWYNTVSNFVVFISTYLENTSALHLSGDISWSEIRQYLFKFYPEFWPKFETYGYFDFYSSNSVCLPQIFVTVSTVYRVN